MAERLQKLLARAGLGSRRQIESWIAEGRVTVNGRRAGLGDQATAQDRIKVDGRRVDANRLAGPRPRVLLYHKPVGEVTSRRDPEGRPTVFQALPSVRAGRWVTVGRLDLNTAGLLLLTTDGELANRLMHPSSEVDREYAVRVRGEPDADTLRRLQEGVVLDDGEARFESLLEEGGDGSNRWYRVVLREGRHREVRRLWESQGLTVSRLIRVRYGPIALPRDLPRGRWRSASDEEMRALYEVAGCTPPAPPRRPDPRRARRVPRKARSRPGKRR